MCEVEVEGDGGVACERRGNVNALSIRYRDLQENARCCGGDAMMWEKVDVVVKSKVKVERKV